MKKQKSENLAQKPTSRFAHLFADAPIKAQKPAPFKFNVEGATGEGRAAKLPKKPAAILYGEDAKQSILGQSKPAAVPVPVAPQPDKTNKPATSHKGKLALMCRNSCKRHVSRKSEEYRQRGLCDVCGDREEMARFRQQMMARALEHEANGDLDASRDCIEAIPKEARAFVSTDRERARTMLREILATLPLAWVVGELNEGQSTFDVTMAERKRRANGKK